MAEIPELLSYVEEETDLSAIAVTEHDDLRAALATREAWARGRYRFEVILGEEVTSGTQGSGTQIRSPEGGSG